MEGLLVEVLGTAQSGTPSSAATDGIGAPMRLAEEKGPNPAPPAHAGVGVAGLGQQAAASLGEQQGAGAPSINS